MVENATDIIDRLGKLEANQAAMTAKFDAINDQIQKLPKVMERWGYGLIAVIVFALFVIAYGALGERGFNAVKAVAPSYQYAPATQPQGGNG